MQQIPISIIIPTLNEEKYLPKLLKSIKTQTQQPEEIIIVDTFSKDKTVEYAKKFGCKVTFNLNNLYIGGSRNIGAQLANQPYLLFLDADVILPPTFLDKTFKEFLNKKLDVASCYIKPISNLKLDHFIHQSANYFYYVTKKIYPNGPGYCIFSTKKIHERIQGFDESLFMAEDHDYINRASLNGRFDFLKSKKISVSIRRFTKEGRMKLILKYATIEIYRLFNGKVKKPLFNYEFGNYE